MTILRHAAIVGLISALATIHFPQAQPAMRTLVEEMRIVSSDSIPQAELSSVRDLVVAPDGFMFTADPRAGSIRLYDPNGRFVRMFGRQGQGPGEFSPAFYLVGAAGDTVLAYDENRGYIHVYRRNGTFVRTQHLARVSKDRILAGYLSAGRALVKIDYFPTVPGQWMDSLAYRITDSTAAELARISVEAAPPRGAMMRLGARGGMIMQQPFVAAIHTAQDPIGNRAVAVLPHTSWSGRPGQVKLVFMNRDGVQSERVIDLGARRVTAAHRDAFIKKRIDPIAARLQEAGTPRALAEKELRDQLVSSEYLPNVDGVMLGSDGSVWLKEYESSDWVIVSPTGAIAFRVRAPAALRVLQVSMVRLWGVLPDADGLPIILRYRVSGG